MIELLHNTGLSYMKDVLGRCREPSAIKDAFFRVKMSSLKTFKERSATEGLEIISKQTNHETLRKRIRSYIAYFEEKNKVTSFDSA